jgi:hypothetical protein
VSRAVTHWTESGATTTVPEAATVSALVPLPAGGYSTVVATPRGTGSWSLSGLAPGPVLLRIETSGGTDYVETSATAVDVGRDQGGRPFSGYADPPVDMTFGLSGLDPWDVYQDQLQLFSWETAWWDLFPPFEAAGGEEALDVLYTWYGPSLEAGDTFDATQCRSAAVGDFTAIASVAAGRATIATAAPASVAIAMEPLTPNRTVDVDWRVTEFEALGPSMGTGQTAYPMPHLLLVAAIPAPLVQPSPVGNASSIDYLDLLGPQGAADLTATLGYAAPMGAAYREFLYVGYRVALERTAPGASSPRTIHAAVYQQLAAVPATIAPILGPVAPWIDGRDALDDLTGVGTTPLLAWSAPSLGEATHTEVEIREIYADAGASRSRTVATLQTAGTEIEVPPGVLEAGRAYVAIFRVVWSPDDEPETAPFRAGLPRAQAETVSGVFEP